MFDKHLINLIMYISVNTWNTWFDLVMCHPEGTKNTAVRTTFQLSFWSTISRYPPPLHTSDIALHCTSVPKELGICLCSRKEFEFEV